MRNRVGNVRHGGRDGYSGAIQVTADAEGVRQQADLIQIATRYNVKLRKSGAQLVGLCPFHREKTASFYIHPGKQVFKCHGCGAAGDVFTFVQRIEGVDFPHALRLVADLTGIPLGSKPWNAAQRRDYRAHQAELDLLTHFRMVEGYPEREAGRAAMAFRATCEADPEYRSWLAEDLSHAKATCGLIVVMLARSPQRGEDLPVPENAE
jgi:CHC2 zinc finger